LLSRRRRAHTSRSQFRGGGGGDCNFQKTKRDGGHVNKKLNGFNEAATRIGIVLGIFSFSGNTRSNFVITGHIVLDRS
jgi:hypothetical protein